MNIAQEIKELLAPCLQTVSDFEMQPAIIKAREAKATAATVFALHNMKRLLATIDGITLDACDIQNTIETELPA